jgi:large subunit ribosomal protein L21
LADEGSGQIGRNLYWVKNMYAVIKTGGKQYRVSAGQVVKVESLVAEPGGPISFDEVMAIFDGDNVRVGAPLVPGASVKATVIGHGRHPKVTIFKMRRRKHFQKRAGHRQNFTEVRIESIA